MRPLERAIAELDQVLETVPAELQAISEQESSAQRRAGSWSRKQILGHLIDSAAVNHQRFVRAQLEPGTSLLYKQDSWVEVQQYQKRSWAELIELWIALNRHILHVIRHIPSDRLENLYGQGGPDGSPWTLSALIADYAHHMQHHLEQIRGPHTGATS